MEKKKIVSKNIMEELVDMNLRSLMELSGICKCEQCRADVRALALNKLPSRYVVSTGGDIFVRVNAMTLQSQADITTAIIAAIAVVKDSPIHNEEDLKGVK